MRCGVPTLCALLALLIAGVSAQEEAQAPGSAAVDLTPRNFDKATGAGKEKPFLVMFWASWCNACHTTLHSLDEAARTLHHEDGIGVAKVEVAKHNALRKRFSAVVHAFPTIVLLRDGKMYKLPARDHQSSKMVEFARSTYKNVQPLPIPSGPSILDTIRSQASSAWKRYTGAFEKFRQQIERRGAKRAIIDKLRKEPFSEVTMTCAAAVVLTALIGVGIYFSIEDMSRPKTSHQEQKDEHKKRS